MNFMAHFIYPYPLNINARNAGILSMKIVNKPSELEEFKCYLCGTIFKVHPLMNINSDFVKNCELHRDKDINRKEIGNERVLYSG